jgi:hypothetical protein
MPVVIEGILAAVDDARDQGRDLAVAIEAAIPGWVERGVDERYRAWMGEPPIEVAEAARGAGAAARADVGPRVRALLEADIDDQRTTPLALVREAVVYPTRVLADASVPPVARDRFEEERFPDDVYNLTPATFSDLGRGVADSAIAWGAAKAWVHRRRHGAG